MIRAGLIRESFWNSPHVAICDRAIREFGKEDILGNVDWLIRQARLGLQSSPKEDFGTSITEIQQQVRIELARTKRKLQTGSDS